MLIMEDRDTEQKPHLSHVTPEFILQSKGEVYFTTKHKKSFQYCLPGCKHYKTLAYLQVTTQKTVLLYMFS